MYESDFDSIGFKFSVTDKFKCGCVYEDDFDYTRFKFGVIGKLYV